MVGLSDMFVNSMTRCCWEEGETMRWDEELGLKLIKKTIIYSPMYSILFDSDSN